MFFLVLVCPAKMGRFFVCPGTQLVLERQKVGNGIVDCPGGHDELYFFFGDKNSKFYSICEPKKITVRLYHSSDEKAWFLLVYLELTIL